VPGKPVAVQIEHVVLLNHIGEIHMYKIELDNMKLTLPSFMEVLGSTSQTKNVDVTSFFVSELNEYMNKKRTRCGEGYDLRSIIFKNWIYVTMRIDQIFSYLITNSGPLDQYIEKTNVDRSIVEQKFTLLTKKLLDKEEPCITYNPEEKQKLFDNYDPSDKKSVVLAFFNLAFNYFYENNYVIPVVSHIDSQGFAGRMQLGHLGAINSFLAQDFAKTFTPAFNAFVRTANFAWTS
jgi:hypothetical protein